MKKLLFILLLLMPVAFVYGQDSHTKILSLQLSNWSDANGKKLQLSFNSLDSLESIQFSLIKADDGSRVQIAEYSLVNTGKEVFFKGSSENIQLFRYNASFTIPATPAQFAEASSLLIGIREKGGKLVEINHGLAQD